MSGHSYYNIGANAAPHLRATKACNSTEAAPERHVLVSLPSIDGLSIVSIGNC